MWTNVKLRNEERFNETPLCLQNECLPYSVSNFQEKIKLTGKRNQMKFHLKLSKFTVTGVFRTPYKDRKISSIHVTERIDETTRRCNLCVTNTPYQSIAV